MDLFPSPGVYSREKFYNKYVLSTSQAAYAAHPEFENLKNINTHET
jgi:hypothetical protein